MNQRSLPSISVIIRTLNEAKYLPECLQKIAEQTYAGPVELVVVDSGSSDQTVQIAEENGANVVRIKKSDFTFGRSLNVGCAASNGEVLVLLSAHCIPYNDNWLNELIGPLTKGISQYSYGKQISRNNVSKFSEGKVFQKYYSDCSAVPQIGYFCNNANSAILRSTWEALKFNERLTGLEDMEIAKRLLETGGSVSYVSSSIVEHIHEEDWKRIRIRYEREAAALADIEPNLNLTFLQAIILFLLSTISDIRSLNVRSLLKIREVIYYRACQYYGSFLGSHASKQRISKMRNEYFYPKTLGYVVTLGEENDVNDSVTTDESS